ncbi:hypothetical protein BU16DRAFT_484474 [Lophium mytilinum]|uniref:Uncharacterized protein n=1 Tax=Lophium mytilinum TaxID=390894 RepID=A0A6A6QZ38_9PEZI|nr:hypothetical protein BU16DRAFT_484474 [Lophium mytilinum]
MAEVPAIDLSYGHFGTPFYDSEQKQWLFQRQPRKQQILKSLTSSTIFSSTGGNQTESEILETIKEKPLYHNIKALAQHNPDLVPVLEALPELSKVSASIVSVVSSYDPAVGDLLAFGHITNIDIHDDGDFRIAAMPCGETGHMLRIIRVHDDRQGWGDDKSVWLNVPSLHKEEGWSGWWPGEGVSIRQICFGDSSRNGSFMAARMPAKTVLFRPVLRWSPVETRLSERHRLPPSKLDPHPILDIPFARTGGSPHADVSFNPWYRRQLAFVDEEGNWSVWELVGQDRKRVDYDILCSYMGTIAPPDPEEPISDVPKSTQASEDGWAKILWIGDVHTIVVCNRRQMAVLDISGENKEAVRLKCPDFGLARTSSWILDVRRSPQNQKRFFVLTSTMLYLVEVRSGAEDIDFGLQASEAAVILSWRHFRGAEDVTLQIRMFTSEKEETRILIFSRLNNFISVLQCTESIDGSSSLPGSSLAPTQLRLPSTLVQDLTSGKHIASLAVDNCPYGKSERPGDGPGRIYIGNDSICFYNITAILDDLSAHQILIHSQKAEDQGETDVVVKQPSWRKKGYGVALLKKSSKYVTENENDDFIVPDGIPNNPDTRGSRIGGSTTDRSRTRPTLARSQDWADDGPWSVSNEFMYNELRELGMHPDREGNPGEDMISLLERLRIQLDEDDTIRAEPFGTLFDLILSQIQVADIDDVSSKFDELFQSALRQNEPDQPQLEIRTAHWLLKNIAPDSDAGLSIASVYDELLRTYIAPLPRNIPIRIRQVKERVARLVSTEVLLASSRLRYVDLPPPKLEETQLESQEIAGFTLPVRPSGKGKERESEPPSCNARPGSNNPTTSLPTPETTPSLASGSTFTSSSHGSSDNPYTRLKQHLQITKPQRLTQSDLSAGSQVLLHWRNHFGQDPVNYDWEATTKAIKDTMSINEDDGMSETQRARLRRKAERHLKRQRRETAAADAALSMPRFTTSESQPSITSELTPLRSSPGPYRQENSQFKQASSQPALASQVERGVFGGRPEAKKTKKKNKGGKLPGVTHAVPIARSPPAVTPQQRNVLIPHQHSSRFLQGDFCVSQRVLSAVTSTKKLQRTYHPTMSDFPSLQPAFTVRVVIDAPLSVGDSKGSPLVIVPMTSGTVKSEPGFEPKLDAELHGVAYDYIHNDATGEAMRLDVRSQLKNNDGTLLAMYYKGTVNLTDGVKAILSGSPDASTSPYGDSFTVFTFESGNPAYKALTNGTYVAAGHFVIEPGTKGVIVEYKVSLARAG